jgi:hypothetical protein
MPLLFKYPEKLIAMTKLPAVRPRQIVRFLEQDGFILDHVPAAILFSIIPPRAAGRLCQVITGTCRKER